MGRSGGSLAHEIPNRVLDDLLGAVRELRADVAAAKITGAGDEVRHKWLARDVAQAHKDLGKLRERVRTIERRKALTEALPSPSAGAVIAGATGGSILFGLIELARSILGKL